MTHIQIVGSAVLLPPGTEHIADINYTSDDDKSAIIKTGVEWVHIADRSAPEMGPPLRRAPS